jgi:uncharacterized protein YjiS (DUF1127 family)
VQRRHSGTVGIISGENAAILIFPLKTSRQRYAFIALLRRNIDAFLAAQHPYFPGNPNSPARPAATNRGIAMFANIIRIVRAWKRYHQSLSELNRLGDRELADIGISRSDIPRVAWSASHKA